jgi:hypothetical protein
MSTRHKVVSASLKRCVALTIAVKFMIQCTLLINFLGDRSQIYVFS